MPNHARPEQNTSASAQEADRSGHVPEQVCGQSYGQVWEHSLGPQDYLLSSEARESVRDLHEPLFARAWEEQGFAEAQGLPGRAVAALQARLLVRLFERLGCLETEKRQGSGSLFYRSLLAPYQSALMQLQQSCRQIWETMLEAPGAVALDESEFVLLAPVRKILASLPLTSGKDIAGDYRRFLCTSQDEVARIVTLTTSGSTGAAKRLAFGVRDLERTRKFFAAGMAQIVGNGDVLLVCLPGAERPDGVADLLNRGLSPLGVTVHALPSAASDQVVQETIAKLSPTSLVLAPRQLQTLLQIFPDKAPGRLRSFLVSADWCDHSLLQQAQKNWQVATLDHYGITETCFGCALECRGKAGYHIRHADVLYEIIDPLTGEILPPGEVGELVLTTLRQEVMPLVRYRTGDAASLRIDACHCTSPLSRIDQLLGRFAPGTRDIIHPKKGERCHVPLSV